jgi:hypothetical protein
VTIVRTVAAHEIVQSVYPHPVTERDELGMAVGKAIDGTLSRYSHEFREARRPTASAMNRLASEMLDEELADSDLTLAPEDREKQLGQISGVVQAFRRSELMGLRRPRSRLVLVDERVGFYAQPDFWNGRDRFYEMKSYRAPPIPAGVTLQLKLFQLAFPGFHTVLAAFDRHASPVTTTLTEIDPLAPEEGERLLRTAVSVGTERGQDKVLEYIDVTVVRYRLPSA